MSAQPAPDDDPAKPSLKALALRSATWTVGGRFLAQGLRLISNIILARLLFPEAFGLTAIVGAFMYGLSMFSDLGVGPSIVYNERGDEPEFLNTAWTIQIIRGAIITLGALALTWPVAEFYGDPELKALLAVAGCVGVIQGFESVVLHTQQRKIELGPVIQLEVIGQVVTMLVMIGWALVSPTVWALVGGSLIGIATKTALSHLYLPHFAHRLHWDLDSAKEVYKFGGWIFLSSIFTFIAVQGDRLLLGHYLSLSLLGVYSVATRFPEALMSLQKRLTHAVLFSVFSETARANPERLIKRYYKIRLYTDLLFLTAAGLLFTTGHVIIDLLYDERYQNAGWMLQVLSLQVAMAVISTSEETLLFSVGKTYYGFARSLAKAIWILVGIPIGWRLYGLTGVVWCVALAEVPVLVVIWTGMLRQNLFRPIFELRSLGIWCATCLVGWSVEALFL